jgi:hypothetical protein
MPLGGGFSERKSKGLRDKNESTVDEKEKEQGENEAFFGPKQ